MKSSITPRPDKISLGVALIVSAVFMMSVQEALFKKYSADLSLWQIFTLRGLLAVPLLCVIAFFKPEGHGLWGGAFSKWALLRSLYLTMMFVGMYAAIPFISLSTVAAGIYTAPLFVSLLSAYVIGEPVGLKGWTAIVTGFIGVIVILQPGTDAFQLWAILPLIGGLMYALANVTTRSKCQHLSATSLALSLNVALLLTGVLISFAVLISSPSSELLAEFPYLFGEWSAVGFREWGFIAVLAVFVVAIGIGLAGAYQCAPPTVVATFDYCYLVFVVFWDYLLFSIVPGASTLIGLSLIIFAGFLVIRR